MRHDGISRQPLPPYTWRTNLSVLQREVPGQVSGISGRVTCEPHADTRQQPSAQAVLIYTCPMHPEIRQPAPGNCPKCGMALEPVEPADQVERHRIHLPDASEVVRNEPGSCPMCGMALEPRNAPAEDNAELNDMTRRFWVSAALALPVFVMAMASDLAPQAHAGIRLDDRAAMAGIRAGHAGGAVGRLADLPARLGIAGQPQPQHVHPDRARRRRGLELQRGGDAAAGHLSASDAQHGWHGAGVFRGGGGDHGAGAAGAGDGAARAQPDQRRDQIAAGPGAQDRAHRARRRQRGRHPAGTGAAGRCAARASRREGAGGRRGAGRHQCAG